jgi:hypothetical protein
LVGVGEGFGRSLTCVNALVGVQPVCPGMIAPDQHRGNNTGNESA